MAAALIPLALNVVPLVFPLVAKLMDKIFGDKTGPIKLSTGTTVLETLLKSLQASLAGTGVSLPTDPAEIQKLLQSTVDDLKSKGQLIGTGTPVDTGTGNRALAITLLKAAEALLAQP